MAYVRFHTAKSTDPILSDDVPTVPSPGDAVMIDGTQYAVVERTQTLSRLGQSPLQSRAERNLELRIHETWDVVLTRVT